MLNGGGGGASTPLTGEEVQEVGREGVRRAKRWLESTCRAEVYWDNPKTAPKKLQYLKAAAASGSRDPSDYFSFDLGGIITGEDATGDTFVAEVKRRADEGKQGIQYRHFLAEAYRAHMADGPRAHEHFMWITWTPFSVKSWPHLLTTEYVVASVQHDVKAKRIALGDAVVDEDVAAAVGRKLMVVVLADRQLRTLSLQGGELLSVRQALIDRRSRG